MKLNFSDYPKTLRYWTVTLQDEIEEIFPLQNAYYQVFWTPDNIRFSYFKDFLSTYYTKLSIHHSLQLTFIT